MASRELKINSRVELDVVTVRPGDTLIVRVPLDLSMDGLDEVKAALRDRLPGVEPLIVAADQLLVYRPASSADDGEG
jgi:hypothetical protein